METLDQRRRRMMTGKYEGDSERSQDLREREAALSQSSEALNGATGRQEPAQEGPGLLRPTSLGGCGSPDTMERGMMPLVPSPFHSDRVRAEIELQRSRPATLDRDAATMAASSNLAARVARVDTSVEPQESIIGQGVDEQRPLRGPKCPLGWMGRARIWDEVWKRQPYVIALRRQSWLWP